MGWGRLETGNRAGGHRCGGAQPRLGGGLGDARQWGGEALEGATG